MVWNSGSTKDNLKNFSLAAVGEEGCAQACGTLPQCGDQYYDCRERESGIFPAEALWIAVSAGGKDLILWVSHTTRHTSLHLNKTIQALRQRKF